MGEVTVSFTTPKSGSCLQIQELSACTSLLSAGVVGLFWRRSRTGAGDARLEPVGAFRLSLTAAAFPITAEGRRCRKLNRVSGTPGHAAPLPSAAAGSSRKSGPFPVKGVDDTEN